MDPPAVDDHPAGNLNRRLPPRRRRGPTSRLVEWTLIFTICFVILTLLKLEPTARNLVQSNNSENELELDKVTRDHLTANGNQVSHEFLRFGQESITPPVCTEPRGEICLRPSVDVKKSSLVSADDDKYSTLYTCAWECPIHSTCFMGTCLCHPGYGGPTCNVRKEVANPWYTADCPNLAPHRELTYSIDDEIGGNKDCTGNGRNPCAYLCYSGEEYGTVIVPQKVWFNAQQEEGKRWRRHGRRGWDGDRYEDHFQGFADFKCIPENLGKVAEFGAGPWTQFRGLLSKQPHVKVESYTVLDPGADDYIKNVATCSYRTGQLMTIDRKGFHDFPVHVISDLAETSMSFESKFDTVMATNVIEHVQNAVDFLHGLHKRIKPGGLLIFHDPYYNTPLYAPDKVLENGALALSGGSFYHPIRPTKHVMDKFLSHFDIIFNNCVGHLTIDSWKKSNSTDDRGYYVIARKK